MTSLLILEKVEVEVGAIPRTKVTFWAEVKIGGNIKMKYLKNRTQSFLSSVSEMRSRFDKSAEIDGRNRDAIVERMEQDRSDYSISEAAQIEKGLERRIGRKLNPLLHS